MLTPSQKKQQVIKQKRIKLYDDFWANIEPSIAGYGRAIAYLLEWMPDSELKKAVDKVTSKD